MSQNSTRLYATASDAVVVRNFSLTVCRLCKNFTLLFLRSSSFLLVSLPRLPQVDPEAKDVRGQTPLMHALTFGCVRAAEAIVNKTGRPALVCACACSACCCMPRVWVIAPG